MDRRFASILGGCLSIGLSIAHANGSDAIVSRAEGLLEYEAGHYAAAVRHFQSAAESGDVRSAEMLCLMYRFGTTLYGGQIAPSPAEAARWAALAASGRRVVAANADVPGR